MSRQVYSYCRGCVAHCGLIFEVEGNRIVSHRGDPDHVNSKGFKCVKGDMSVEHIQGLERRFTSCHKRNSEGRLEPIASAALMDEVAAAIARGVRDNGPRSVALYIGTAGYRKSFNLSMAKQFMAAIGSPSMFSTMTIDQSAHWVVDGRMGVFVTGKPAFEDLDLIVLAGTNPVISHGGPYVATPLVNTVPKLRSWRERGGKLVVVDPRVTETARLADVHLQARPGADAEIFAGLIRLILANGWHDADFCARYVQGLDALRAAVEPFTAERVAERADVPLESLLAAARLIGAAKKPSMGFGTGLSMSPHPNTAAHMVEGLNAICGGFARAGEVIRNPGIFQKRALVEAVVAPTRTWEREPKLGTGFGALYGEFPSSRLADEILTPGPTQIRTLIVLGANPMMAFGEPQRLREALTSLDCLVVVEPRPTETTDLADYLVAPPLPYEVADINVMVSGWHEDLCLQATDPVVEPPPGTLTEWMFFNGLANRLGHTLRLMPVGFGGDVTAAAAAGTPLVAEEVWTTERLIERALADVGVPLEALRAAPHGLKPKMPTVRIAAPGADDGARLDVCPPDVAAELAGVMASPPAGARYRLVVRRVVELMNSEFRMSETIQRRFDGAAPLFIHPHDMAEEGFGPGDRVAVSGRHGRIVARIRPDRTLRRGVVAMPHCWSGDPSAEALGGHTSNLVSMAVADVQAIDGMPQQSALIVDLARA
jgi:anaerobic selenocysteine-containing dehydrogenase